MVHPKVIGTINITYGVELILRDRNMYVILFIVNANGCSSAGCRTLVTIDEEIHHGETDQKKSNSNYWDQGYYKFKLQIILEHIYISIDVLLIKYIQCNLVFLNFYITYVS